MKGKGHHYNPLGSASFRQHQLATVLASDWEYKKNFEENKGSYHFDAEAPEHLHHKGNATLQSQVKYREEYEKNKGKSMLDFVETPSYQSSKEAQKMQSEPSEEPLRTHSKIGNEKRYCSSLMHAIHYGNGHHPQQHEHSHLKWQPRGSSWTALAGLFPYILLKGNDEGSCIQGCERGN